MDAVWSCSMVSLCLKGSAEEFKSSWEGRARSWKKELKEKEHGCSKASVVEELQFDKEKLRGIH